MLVTAYGKSCPFKNSRENVRNADMWLTALETGAMTLRYEEFSFAMPFFVSVVVPDTDDDCRLPHEVPPQASVANRTKRVTVGIERTEPYKKYFAPVLTSVAVCFAFILFAFVVMSTKSLDDKDKAGETENDGASVYYSPAGSRADVTDRPEDNDQQPSVQFLTETPQRFKNGNNEGGGRRRCQGRRRRQQRPAAAA